MAEVKKLGSVRRFGARYGRRVKHKLAKIESVQRGKHKCPYCRSLKVKRLSVGIWHCGRCQAKFAGKAYSIKGVTSNVEVEETVAKTPKKVVEVEEEEQDFDEADEEA